MWEVHARRPELLNTYTEAMTLAKQQRVAARHTADMASKTMATSIAVRGHTWLRFANIVDDTKARIEDLLFNTMGLFSAKTDDMMENIHKMRKTVKSYVPQQPY